MDTLRLVAELLFSTFDMILRRRVQLLLPYICKFKCDIFLQREMRQNRHETESIKCYLLSDVKKKKKEKKKRRKIISTIRILYNKNKFIIKKTTHHQKVKT